MATFTINGLVYETINNDNEVMLLKTEGLKRPVRNIPAEVEYNGKKYKVTEVYGGGEGKRWNDFYDRYDYYDIFGAFHNDDILCNVSFPETITTIRDSGNSSSGAFRVCQKLKDIHFSDSLVEIGRYAFYNCVAIESLCFGDNLKTIGSSAFSICSALMEIDFNDKLETIGSWAFSNCSSLVNIELPDAVTRIYDYAFNGCTSLKNVSFPESLKKIGDRAFKGCKAMTEVNIPASVETIGDSAFAESGVKVVNIYSENINIASDAFPADAQINFLDANSFPKRKRKPRGNKTAEAPKPAPKPEPKKEEPKPAPKPEPKPEPKREEQKPTPKQELTEVVADGEGLKLTNTTTITELTAQFNARFGSVLRIYNGRSKAEDSAVLKDVGLSNEGTFVCRASLTVGSFIERMQNEFGLKVKVYTCDEWVAVLDGLTLESSGKVKKNAVKADMESMIAYQRSDNSLGGYSIEAKEDGGFLVKKDGIECENAKAAMREIAAIVGLEVDPAWTTRQFGAKLLKTINK